MAEMGSSISMATEVPPDLLEKIRGRQGVSPRFLEFSQAFGATGSILDIGCSLSVARPWIPTSDDPSARLR